MNRCVCFATLVFLSLLPFVLSQEGSTNSQSPAKTTGMSKSKNKGALNSSAISDAMKKDEFALTKNKDAYKLDEPIDLTADQPGRTSVSIDYQIGTIDQKPAFATVVVDPKAAPKTPEDVDSFLGGLPDKQQARTSGSTTVMQKCSDGEVCVRTKVIDNKPVCVEWRCK